MQRDTTPRCSDPIREPYQGGFRYRVIVRGGESPRRTSSTFAKEKDALAFIKTFRAEYEATKRLTVADALTRYDQAQEVKGLSAGGRETTLLRLRGLLAPYLSHALTSLTPVKAKAAYKAYQTRDSGKARAAATHQGALNQAKTFFSWCLSEKLLPANPFGEVKPEGARNRRKLQLRTDEARRFVQLAAQRYLEHHDEGALAALLALLLGLRASEVINRKVRDVDADCSIFVVELTKTKAGDRRLEIPETLRPFLQRLTQGRAGEELLFGERHRGWVRENTQRLCKLAGVTVVTAQSLRGLHASLAVSHGLSPQVVAQALGHTSSAVTLGHYATPEAAHNGATRGLLRVIEGGAHPSQTRPTKANRLTTRRAPKWREQQVSSGKKESLSKKAGRG